MPGVSSAIRENVVVVGSGFGGICMGIRLRQAGRTDFVILEHAGDLGGTWRDNTYPGAACDIQSHMYSYSFEPNPRWTRMFSPQQEIWDYLRRCADKYGVTPHIRYHAEVTGARYDEDTARWCVEVNGVEAYSARVLVSAIGVLHQPKIPALPGVETYQGDSFHSAQWRHDVDLTGKRVAVVGTGASAIQFVPEIAKQAAQVDVYQRTAPWIMSRGDRPLTGREHKLFESLPFAQRLRRTAMYWALESRVLGFAMTPKLMKGAEWMARRHIRNQISDPELAAKVTPDYQIGCKRILISNDYYPTLTRDNVEVVTEGIREVRAGGIVTKDGTERPADAIIYGTGFVVSGNLRHIKVLGREGRDLNTEWDREGENAHLGITVNGFPNFFLVVGPNTALGHNSMIFMIEAQTSYVTQALAALDEVPGETSYVEVRPEVQKSFSERVQGALDHTVWNSGCSSWYLDAKGRNIAIWPSFTWRYWLKTRRLRRSEFVVGTASPAESTRPAETVAH